MKRGKGLLIARVFLLNRRKEGKVGGAAFREGREGLYTLTKAYLKKKSREEKDIRRERKERKRKKELFFFLGAVLQKGKRR